MQAAAFGSSENRKPVTNLTSTPIKPFYHQSAPLVGPVWLKLIHRSSKFEGKKQALSLEAKLRHSSMFCLATHPLSIGTAVPAREPSFGKLQIALVDCAQKSKSFPIGQQRGVLLSHVHQTKSLLPELAPASIGGVPTWSAPLVLSRVWYKTFMS